MTDVDRSTTSENTATQPGARSPAKQSLPWTKLIALTFAAFATVTMEMLPSGLLPQIGRGLGVEPAVAGALVTAWALTVALTSMPLVRATMKVRRTLLIPATLGVVAVSSLVTAFAPTFEVALLGRVAAAAGHGVFWAVIVAYVSGIVAPEQIGRALAIVLSGPTIAGFVGLPLGAALVEVAGWRAIFGGASLVLALTAGLLVPLLADEPDGTDTSGTAAGARWDRSVILSVGTAFAAALVLVAHFVLFTYVALLITEVADWDAGAVAVLLTVFGAASAAGVALSGWLSDRWPRATLPASAFAALAAFSMLCIAPAVPAVFVGAIVIWGGFIGLFPPAMQVRVLRLASPQFRPAAGGVVVTVLSLGVAGGAALGGLIVGSEVAASGVEGLAPVALLVGAFGAFGLLLASRA